jgi:hypothetical protein
MLGIVDEGELLVLNRDEFKDDNVKDIEICKSDKYDLNKLRRSIDSGFEEEEEEEEEAIDEKDERLEELIHEKIDNDGDDNYVNNLRITNLAITKKPNAKHVRNREILQNQIIHQPKKTKSNTPTNYENLSISIDNELSDSSRELSVSSLDRELKKINNQNY